ncbi:hypothetical protein Z946_2973 [Sulfitobacter noctilucicola]|uniref:Uncharacterized protein n=1 Tax=Sulfitobacter noctilucicola TaxID=1342301 RepID=A0A7W6MAE9_9RHOB|nr:hypothetical protein [Sulfitobacter noctilucicola]KIN64086.1 hypothetical protein Z946_2973 [Sulfitobacter noctilucicola]MBB4175440.1 hypothetical protein [Sulfitobacter noctilucicola]
MAQVNKVVRSVNAPGETLCVDVFMRPDASFGFEEFRRDPEDGRGWYPVGHHSAEVFKTAEEAWGRAVQIVTWLDASSD